MARKWLVLCIAIIALCCTQPALADNIAYYQQDEINLVLGLDGLLEVHLINVACADSILLRMGDETMLIDSGTYRTYERITAYLAELGIERLSYAMATHPHDDHIGGFAGVLAEIPCDTFLKPKRYDGFTSPDQAKLDKVLAEKGIAVEYIENESTMQLGKASLTFFQWQDAIARENNRSVVTKVQHGERSILLAADVENNGQRALAEAYGERLSADILKMPHHGLAPCVPEFHEAVQPELGTFSNVKAKIQDVLRTCEKRDVKWMLTTKGTIVMVTDGAEKWHLWQIPRVQE